MIKKVQIIISDDVENLQFGSVNTVKVVNPSLLLKTPVMPTALSFSISVLVMGDNLSDIDKAKIDLRNSENEEIFSTGENTMAIAPNLRDLNINISLRNILIKSSGEYTVVVSLGENVYKESFLIEKI